MKATKFLSKLALLSLAIGLTACDVTSTGTDDNNTGDDNTGDDNTGDDNTGDDNTGDDNTGDDNTGDDNTGDDNTGDDNTGDDNTGDEDTGDAAQNPKMAEGEFVDSYTTSDNKFISGGTVTATYGAGTSAYFEAQWSAMTGYNTAMAELYAANPMVSESSRFDFGVTTREYKKAETKGATPKTFWKYEYTYNDDNMVASIKATDAKGTATTTTLTYDSEGRLASSKRGTGAARTFSYDADGKIEKIAGKHSDGKALDYEYAYSDGKLASSEVIYDGKTVEKVTYEYSDDSIKGSYETLNTKDNTFVKYLQEFATIDSGRITSVGYQYLVKLSEDQTDFGGFTEYAYTADGDIETQTYVSYKPDTTGKTAGEFLPIIQISYEKRTDDSLVSTTKVFEPAAK